MRGLKLISPRHLRRLVGAGFVALLATLSSPSSSQTQSVVEYYHAGWGHYFVTSFQNEITLLDGGAFGGAFQRTGRTFPAWSSQVTGSFPVCRFFTLTFAPRSSHFYTPVPNECAGLRQNPNWQYEAIAFYLKVPDLAGNCPSGSAPLYRLYNDGMSGAPNHRYTDSRTVFDQMRAAGWRPEGYGASLTFACVPSAAAPAPTGPAGLYIGGTTFNQTIWGIVLPEGTFYVIYSTPGTNFIAGVIQGSGTFANGAFGSSNARDFAIGQGVFSASVSGTYVPGVSIQGTSAGGGAVVQFLAQYLPGSQNPPSLAAAAGTYTGTVASSQGYQAATFTLTAAGGFAGSSVGCTFAGTASPRPNVSAFDMTVRFNGGLCIFGTATLTGVAVYDPDFGQMYGAAPNLSRTDGFLFVGGK